MKQFDHEYMSIVDNLRIMGDALVLLNPIKNQVNNSQSKSMQITPAAGQDDAKLDQYGSVENPSATTAPAGLNSARVEGQNEPISTQSQDH